MSVDGCIHCISDRLLEGCSALCKPGNQLGLNEAPQPPFPFAERVRGHPTLYDALCKAAKSATKPGTSIHHVMTAEDASQFVLRGLGVAVLTQAGAWRIARNGITIRPLCIAGLRLETRLACRSDSQGRVVSEFLRGFVRRLKERTNAKQLRLGLVH
jgi:hypothetical protein